MLGQLSLTALAALSVVNGSPVVQKRQVSSAIESAASSAASSVAASATSLASEASSAVSGASSTAAEPISSASSAASTAMSSAMASGSSAVASATGSAAAGNATGTETFPLFPCPPGYLLTYATQNATVPLPITQVTPALGEWASSPIFPNVTMPMGGSEPGATHTINIAGLAINEVLVNATSNSTSGYASFTWNLTNGPIQAPGVSISNWTAELNVYDPDFTTTGEIGNTTVADAFVNFCASDQAAGAGLLNSVLQLYLGNAAMALQGNSSAGGAMTTGMDSMMSSTMMESMASSSMMSASEMASSMATSATAAASSAASSAASGASSAVESATSAAASAASSAVAPAASTTA